MSRLRKRSYMVKLHFTGQGAKNYERIFGSDEQIAARRKKAIEEQRENERREKERRAALVAAGPGIIPDTFKPFFSYALDAKVGSRSEQKNIMQDHYRKTGVKLEQR